MKNKEIIKKWIDFVEKKGAILENIEYLVHDDNVKIVAKDKTKDIIIKIPDNLLIPIDKIMIEDDKHYVDDSNIFDLETIEFINEYLDFIFYSKRVDNLKQFITEFQLLPTVIKGKLKSIGLVNILDNIDPSSNKSLKESLLKARVLNKGNTSVLMPMLDFANHDFKHGINFNIKENSISIEGKPSPNGEVFAVYNALDVFGFLNIYFFPDKAVNAYSRAMRLNIREGKNFLIGRKLFDFKKVCSSLRTPGFIVDKNEIIISFIWIGSTLTPRKPFWSFKYFWEKELGLDDTILAFSKIKSLNIEFLSELLDDLNDLTENNVIKLLKKAIIWQLTVIGNAYEDPKNFPC